MGKSSVDKTTGPPISHAMEDYLKVIYQISTQDEKVSTTKIAHHLSCSPASVTNMLQKLSELKLVEYRPYQGVRLTTTGSRIALEIIRHHRLIELYLSEVLGFSWDKVHAEAERLEHVISEEFESRIDEALGYPTKDPHGHPIPSKEGTLSASEGSSSLWEIEEGTSVTVDGVSDRNPEVLRYLASLGIYPGARLEVVERAPFNGPIQVRFDGREHSFGEELARQIFVITA